MWPTNSFLLEIPLWKSANAGRFLKFQRSLSTCTNGEKWSCQLLGFTVIGTGCDQSLLVVHFVNRLACYRWNPSLDRQLLMGNRTPTSPQTADFSTIEKALTSDDNQIVFAKLKSLFSKYDKLVFIPLLFLTFSQRQFWLIVRCVAVMQCI